MTEKCCCAYGAAVKGEWPEFECWHCPSHGGEFGPPTEMCKRHAREVSNENV